MTLPEAAVLLTLLGLFWLLAGFAGVLGWAVVAIAFTVTPAVVAVAVGQLSIITLGEAAPQTSVAATQVALVALLLFDGVALGWTRQESAAFILLTGVLGGGVVVLAEQTSLLVGGLCLLGVLGVGAVGLSELSASSRVEQTSGGAE